MSALKKITMAWAVKWVSDSSVDGHVEFLMGADKIPPMLFKTRREARDHVVADFGYLEDRPDLKGPPHGWKMPKVVRVKITVAVA